MNACLDDSDLLHFLDGELNAKADARIVAHIEGCVTCQERLERLTRGSPVLGGEDPIETVKTDSEETTDLPGTEDIAPDVGEGPPRSESGRFRSNGFRRRDPPQDRRGTGSGAHERFQHVAIGES